MHAATSASHSPHPGAKKYPTPGTPVWLLTAKELIGGSLFAWHHSANSLRKSPTLSVISTALTLSQRTLYGIVHSSLIVGVTAAFEILSGAQTSACRFKSASPSA
jgi:hypothetical protein